jgi:hypothetical protein
MKKVVTDAEGRPINVGDVVMSLGTKNLFKVSEVSTVDKRLRATRYGKKDHNRLIVNAKHVKLAEPEDMI